MPYPSTFTTFTDATAITAASFNLRVKDIEQFINGDIEQSDLPEDGFVNSNIIVSPEFFGAPAPRVHLQSSDVHYRRARGGPETIIYNRNQSLSTYLPIPGLAATFHVDIPDGYPNDTVETIIRASFFARNQNGVSDGTDLIAVATYLFEECAKFKLFVDGTAIPGTTRNLYPETTAQARAASQNVSMIGVANLSRGLHNVYVGIEVLTTTLASVGWIQQFIRHRSLNIEIHYL